MGSYDFGKADVCAWVRDNFAPDAEILDVGACDGKWQFLLPEYYHMDAVEAFAPNLRNLFAYRKVYHTDIRGFEYEHYDLIILGDIIEHLSVEEAQAVLAYAAPRCRDMIIAVPFLYPQDALYGNPYEIHVQDDLTPERFEERYPGYDVLCDPGHNYRYYHKGDPA